MSLCVISVLNVYAVIGYERYGHGDTNITLAQENIERYVIFIEKYMLFSFYDALAIIITTYYTYKVKQ